MQRFSKNSASTRLDNVGKLGRQKIVLAPANLSGGTRETAISENRFRKRGKFTGSGRRLEIVGGGVIRAERDNRCVHARN